jgi:hypothetical protein
MQILIWRMRLQWSQRRSVQTFNRSVLTKLKTSTHENNLVHYEQLIWRAVGTVVENLNFAMTYFEGQSL